MVAPNARGLVDIDILIVNDPTRSTCWIWTRGKPHSGPSFKIRWPTMPSARHPTSHRNRLVPKRIVMLYIGESGRHGIGALVFFQDQLYQVASLQHQQREIAGLIMRGKRLHLTKRF
jgi:hypothetical protein